VFLALEPPTGASVLNQFDGVVTAIGDESGAQVDVLVHIGDGDHPAPLWARISRKSVHLLGLVPGTRICAFIKSAALDRHSLGRSAAAGRFAGHHD
jgi:molybdate transport system ATP-binding protein